MGYTMVFSFQIAQQAWPILSVMKKAKSHRGYNCSERKNGQL